MEEPEELLPQVNAFFKSYPHSVDGTPQCDDGLSPINPLVPGGKIFGAQLFVGAYNYFPEDAFLQHLRSLEWYEPRHSQLFLMGENDLSFRVVPLGT
jgi:hypothetical protein